MALVALAVIFVAWLWKNLPRPGPLRAAPAGPVRDFTTHLALTGAFLWRQREADALLQPLRDAVKTAAGRLGWQQTDANFISRLAAHCGLAESRVSVALRAAEIRERNLFLRVTQDLQKMTDELRVKSSTQ